MRVLGNILRHLSPCGGSRRGLFVLLLGSWFLTLSAETIIVGHVFDSRTGENISHANIYYRGTEMGCTTNEEGMFMLRAELDKKRTLVISAVGYKTQRYIIEPDKYAGLEVAMEETLLALDEVFVLPGENPALGIMEQVRKHAPQNDVTRHPELTFSLQEQQNLYISDIQQRHLQRRLWKSLQAGMLQAEDSTYLLPLYASQYTYERKGKETHKLTPIQERTTFLTETDYQILLNGLPQTINFYDNTITIFGKSFVSPLASFGGRYYQYKLIQQRESRDTLQSSPQWGGREGGFCIAFQTKNPFIPSFNGEMLIDTATYALRSIQLTVPREVNVNYLSSIQLQQQYTAQNTLQGEHLSMIFDFAIKSDTSHIFPTILLQRTVASSDSHHRGRDGAAPTAIHVDNDSTLQSSPQWGGQEGGFAALDSIPLVQWAKWVAYILHTGEVRMGDAKVNLGNVSEIIGGNSAEGLRVGVPLATNEKLWKNVRLNGYVGYGFRDRAPKWQAQVQFKLPTHNRHVFGTYYWDHYVDTDVSPMDYALRENNILYGDMDFTYKILRGVHSSDNVWETAARRREFKVFAQNEWTDNIETEFAFQMGRMGYGDPHVGYYAMPSYRFRNLSAGIRLGWAEKKIDLHFRRVHLYSRYPVIRLMAEFGSYELPHISDILQSSPQWGGQEGGSESLYGRLTLAVQQRIGLGVCGTLDYAAEAGMVFGAVPYPLLKTFAGNQSWMFDSYRFSLMNIGRYAADKYILLHAHWDMEGLLLNRIPGIRYARLHELLELKVAWGGLSAKNAALKDAMQSLPLYGGVGGGLDIPYVEAGIGIGNVLRVGDFYFVSRLTGLTRSPRTGAIMGFRFRFRLGM